MRYVVVALFALVLVGCGGSGGSGPAAGAGPAVAVPPSSPDPLAVRVTYEPLEPPSPADADVDGGDEVTAPPELPLGLGLSDPEPERVRLEAAYAAPDGWHAMGDGSHEPNDPLGAHWLWSEELCRFLPGPDFVPPALPGWRWVPERMGFVPDASTAPAPVDVPGYVLDATRPWDGAWHYLPAPGASSR